jgi:hypothetical protein
MTEADWLGCAEPERMLTFVGEKVRGRAWALPWAERKVRLFAVACCRRIWRLLPDPRSRAAVEAAEALADDRRSGHLHSIRDAAEEAVWEAESWAVRKAARAAADALTQRARRAWETFDGGWGPSAWDPIDPEEAFRYAGNVAGAAVRAVAFACEGRPRGAAPAAERLAQAGRGRARL